MQDAIRLVGEVYFPNLQFDTNRISFGNILNHTEVTRHVLMTNVSPLTVRFRWSFLVGQRTNIVFKREAQLTSFKYDRLRILNAKLDCGKTDVELLPQSVDEPLVTEEPMRKVEELGEEKLQSVKNTEENEMDRIDEVHVDQDLPCEESNRVLTQLEDSENETLKSLMEQDNDVVPLGIEEVFDITPLYGELEPGQSQPISFVFFGHADVYAIVDAMCEVDGGPTYAVELSGGASEIKYDLDRTEVVYDPVRYDKPAVSHISLVNTGQVDFEFVIFPEAIGSEESGNELSDAPNSSDIITGQLIVEPASGCLGAGEVCEISVMYLARKPSIFERVINLQVAHFEPKRIVLRGVADFPRLLLDLPRYYSSTGYTFIDRTEDRVTNHLPEECPVFEQVMCQLVSDLHLYVTQKLQDSKAQGIHTAVCSCFRNLTKKLKMTTKKENFSGKANNTVGRDDLDPLFLHEPACPVAKIVHKALVNSLNSTTLIPVELLEYIPDIGLQMEAERCHLCDQLESRFDSVGQRESTERMAKEDEGAADVISTKCEPMVYRNAAPNK